jgi:dihydrofolate reductase
MIWAMDENNLIGDGNKIPWHVKEDLLYYKEKTKGKTVVMGEATYYSLKGYYKEKPLPYGKIYVASLDKNLSINDGEVVNDLNEFLTNFEGELWVCGGATIYKVCMPYANRLYISFIQGEHKGDKYFPKINYDEFNLIWENKTEKVRYTIFERK